MFDSISVFISKKFGVRYGNRFLPYIEPKYQKNQISNFIDSKIWLFDYVN
jgi:hypothetical protein